jgi:hypothetical protein
MQQLLVVLIFTTALAYLGYRVYLKLQKKADCDSDCGCEAAPIIAKYKENRP